MMYSSVCDVLSYTCCTGLLEIYQQLLGLKFSEVNDAEAWNTDVQLVRITSLSYSLLK